jgi:hypothetical protein
MRRRGGAYRRGVPDRPRHDSGTFGIMATQSEKAVRFLELHRPGDPLLLPNPWDQGSARLLGSAPRPCRGRAAVATAVG